MAMSVVLSVLLAVEESEESSGGVFGLIWFAGSGWGLWHLNKRRKREGFTDWLGAVVVAFTVWWFFLLQVLVSAWLERRRNRRMTAARSGSDHGSSQETAVRPHIPAGLRYEVLERDGGVCVVDGEGPPEQTLHIDHIVPLSRGGTTTLDNLQTLCSRCNQGKGNRYNTDWRH
tara:strand:- start:102 stop:620 length:519 start_codon:yes stop_codon:yes gene_type:complete